jgi:gluconolactonase
MTIYFVTLAMVLTLPAQSVQRSRPAAPVVPSPCEMSVSRLLTGFHFTEGPTFDKHGNFYFTDQRDRGGKIYRLDAAGKLSVIVAPSGRANGLAINSRDELIACQADGRVVAYALDGTPLRVLAAGWRGKNFNAPNDLVIDEHDGIYFTDPMMGAPLRSWLRHDAAVYYIAPDGGVKRLIDNLAAPNGIGMSPDRKTLYVVPSLDREVMAYPILGPGQLGRGRVAARVARDWFPVYVGGDGMTVDAAGNLWIASHRGVQVFDPAGRLLRIIAAPEPPANVAFGPDGTTLYITAKHSVYVARQRALQ